MSSEGTAAPPTQRALLDAASAELSAFERVGRNELGLEAWHAAREAAEKARRDCWAGLRAQYGARNPRGGWATFALIASALCAAVSAVLTSGFRFDPAGTATIATMLAVVAVLGALLVVVASWGRPLNRGLFRPLLVVAIGLGLGAAFQATKGLSTAPAAAGAAVGGIGALLAFFVFRARDHKGTEEIDTAINVVLDRMRPEVAAVGARMQAELTARLSVQEQEAIVSSRGTVPAGPVVSDSAPAGGVIIAVMLSTWIPETMREEGA